MCDIKITGDLRSFLQRAGIREDIIQKFEENDITLEEFGLMERDEIREIGITDLKSWLGLKPLIRKMSNYAFPVSRTPNVQSHAKLSNCDVNINSSGLDIEDQQSQVKIKQEFSEIQETGAVKDVDLSSMLYKTVFDIKPFLIGRLKELSDKYTINGDFSFKDRKELVNILMEDFVTKHGYYYNLTQLENLAKSMVLSWPNLGSMKIDSNGEEILNSDCLFIRNGGPKGRSSGTLYFKLEYLRQSLPPSKRKITHTEKDVEQISKKPRIESKQFSPIVRLDLPAEASLVFDVKPCLKGRFQELCDKYATNGNFTCKERKELINILMEDFVFKHGYYDNLSELENLEKSMVLTWPNLGTKKTDINGKETLHKDYLFNRNGGKKGRSNGILYYKLEYLRQSLSPSKKKFMLDKNLGKLCKQTIIESKQFPVMETSEKRSQSLTVQPSIFYINCDVNVNGSGFGIQDQQHVQVEIKQESSDLIQDTKPFKDTNLSSMRFNTIIDIKPFLSGRLKELSDKLTTNCDFPSKDRKELVNILMDDFVSKHGYYDNLSQLENLSKSMVLSWPNLGTKKIDNNGEETLHSDCLFIRNGGKNGRSSGPLYFKLEYLRQSLPASKRMMMYRKDIKRNSKLARIENESFSPLELVEILTMSKSEIIDKLKETVKTRKAFSLTASINDIFQKYDHYKLYNGEFISLDFTLFFDKTDNKFNSIMHHKDFFFEQFPNLFENSYDDELKLICSLWFYFSKKYERESTEILENEYLKINTAFLRFYNNGRNIDDLMQNSENMQPHLVFLGNPEIGGKYYLVIQKNYISLGDNCAIHAFIILFKTHYIFNIEYSDAVFEMFSFIENAFYDFKTIVKFPKVLKLLEDFGKYIALKSKLAIEKYQM